MEDNNGTHWPTTDDRLFEEIHLLRGAKIADDVRERCWRLGNGYREGANHLVTSCVAQPPLGRNLIYPIIYLYRHSFELALKMFLVDHGPEAGEDADFQSHRLDRLWAKCVRVINYY